MNFCRIERTSNYGKNVTINTIAERTKYSKTAVSRALSGKGRVPEKTANLIKKCADELGYSPNTTARALAVSKTNNSEKIYGYAYCDEIKVGKIIADILINTIAGNKEYNKIVLNGDIFIK